MTLRKWSEKFNYLCFDMTENKIEGKYSMFNERKNTYIESICATEAFKIFEMLFPIKNIQELEQLKELVSLQNQIQEVRLQDKLGKQNYHYLAKKLQKPLIDKIKDTSEKLTKATTETSINNNKALENLNEKVLELMNDRGMIAPNLANPLDNLSKPENKSQFRLIKDLNSIEMNDFLINDGIPVTLYCNMLTFRDSRKIFKLDGDLLGTIRNMISMLTTLIQKIKK